MNKVIGNPVPYKIGRKTYLVGYVSMLQWQQFGELQQLDEVHALSELLYYSMHRADDSQTRRDVGKLMKRKMEKLLPLVDLICDMSLPKLKGETNKLPPANRPSDSERDIKVVYRLLSRMHGWTPKQIGEMSPAQVYIYLTGGPDGTGIVKMSNSQYKSFLAARRGGLN